MSSASEQESDASLWLAATSGSDRAFARIYDRHRRRIYAKALMRLGDIHDAEDAVAAVFLEAWRGRKRVRFVDDSLLPWLLTVTVNVTLNLERSRRRYRRLLAVLPDPGITADHAEVVAEYLDTQPQMRRLSLAMQRLSQVDQALVELVLVEEMAVNAAAQVLEIPVGTAKSKLHRARKRLQVEVAESSAIQDARRNPEVSGGRL